MNLLDFVPDNINASTDELLGRFLEYIDYSKIRLYPAQESAILELFEDKNVILNTPTGSGKSLVATALLFKSLSQGKKAVYTCPIKALVNEKWLSFCKEFGPEQVGISTGDASVNRDAPILCCTAEILSNIALHEGELSTIEHIVMDEFHYYADRERGVAWQVPLLTMPQSQFLLMSATMGDTQFFEQELTRVTKKNSVRVYGSDRPVPLEFSYVETPLPETLESLLKEGKAPIYVVHFTQLEAAQNAQNFTSIPICTKEEKSAINEALVDVKFNSPYGPDIKRWLRHGIGIHHAGLLPKYRMLVEKLAQKGLLKVICGTDTLGVGINIPIRTVLFSRLCKFDGQKTAILSARDFHQISGRAGRKGFDDIGWVVAQAPEYVIENIQLERKRLQGGKKIVKRRPPEKNFANWDEATFKRLILATPEQLVSRFQVSHGMLLNVLSRPSDGCEALRTIIKTCHDSVKQKQEHMKRAWQLFRSLKDRSIIEFISPTPQGAKLRVNVSLQEDFSMDQELSLFLLEAIGVLDCQDPDYHLQVLTLAESIVEDPDFILRKQLDKIKEKKMAEMKMEGIPFEERIEELDKLEYPKPEREFIEASYENFSSRHPWVGRENIRIKSIAREMIESFGSFADYIKLYGLERSEGLLLRHLNSVYKVLSQTVPESSKTESLAEIETFLGAMIRQIDSSILDEWERMRNPNFQEQAKTDLHFKPSDALLVDITRDEKSLVALIRARIFGFLKAISKGDYSLARTILEENEIAFDDKEIVLASAIENLWDENRLRDVYTQFKQEHQVLRIDPEARNIRHTYIKKDPGNKKWHLQQMLVDPDETNDWVAEFTIDIEKSRKSGMVIWKLEYMGELGGYSAE